MRQSGTTLAATNDLSAGSVCKQRDAVTLGRKKGLQPRAYERPADSFSFKLGRHRPASACPVRRYYHGSTWIFVIGVPDGKSLTCR